MSRSRKAPRTRRQARKAEARAAGTGFTPIMGEMHPHGNRHARRHASAVARSRVGDGWRRKKALRGEYYGRKLENLIRSGAPLAHVRAEQIIIRSLLA